MPTVTNQVACSALNGANVIVTLNSSDTSNVLPGLYLGRLCTNGSSSKTGYISEIDFYGNTFRIAPVTTATNFASTSPRGVFAVGETVTIV